MIFAFRAGESVQEGVQRIGLAQIDAVRADLDAEPTGRSVHDARRRCKMLRALLRLVRGGLEAGLRRTENQRWREIAHALGSARDAEVRLDTFRLLVSRPNACADLARQIEADAEAASRASLSPAQLRRLRAQVTRGRTVWEKFTFTQHGWRLLLPGLRASYRGSRRAWQVVSSDPTDEALHEWRKQVKALGFHIRLIGRIRPTKLKPLDRALADLGLVLGEDRDLALLRGYAQRYDTRSLAVLDPLIAHRRQSLQRKAHRLAERALASDARSQLERLEGWWHEWRK